MKEIIENSTYEKRKSKKRSRIRAKTLEGHVAAKVPENLKGLINYAQDYARNSRNGSIEFLSSDISDPYNRPSKYKKSRLRFI